MVVTKFQESLHRYALEHDYSVTIIEGFDNSILGITEDGRLIYSLEKMIEEFMSDNDCDYSEALEFIEYNTLRALPYVENQPIILYDTVENILNF